MIAHIRVDTSGADKLLGGLRRQLPFATSKALNNTAIDAQRAERARLNTVFTIRRKEFIERQGVKIKPFATKTSPSVTIGIDPKADFLTKFEAGGTKRPREGRSLAIPVAVKRNKRDIVTRANRPRALLSKGSPRFFAVREGEGDGLAAGVYQILGGARNKRLRMLYAFIDSATIEPTLGFVDTITRTVRQRWTHRFGEALALAIRTARP